MAGGEAIFSSGVAERVVNYFVHPPVTPVNPAVLSELSERESEVLTLIAQGLTNADISRASGAQPPKTVRNYISETCSLLQVSLIVSRPCSVHGRPASDEALSRKKRAPQRTQLIYFAATKPLP
ncbi:MAG: hypothetical protein NVS4B11_13190 [Ktedonobacteraceae bacterium]